MTMITDHFDLYIVVKVSLRNIGVLLRFQFQSYGREANPTLQTSNKGENCYLTHQLLQRSGCYTCIILIVTEILC